LTPVISFFRFLLAALALALVPDALAERTVLVFGDSLSAAYGLSVEQGWVHLLGRRAAGLGWRVVNASVSGETTAGGLSRLPEDLKRHKPDVVLIELGANDALRGLSLSAMRVHLENMVRLVRDAKAQPILIGMMIPPNYGIDYAVEFRQVFAKVAQRNAIPLVPFLLQGLADRPEYFQADQVHPTAAAQPMVLDNVWPVLEPLLKKR
jgi:acyl-CoA thioesterase-1